MSEFGKLEVPDKKGKHMVEQKKKKKKWDKFDTFELAVNAVDYFW